MLKWRLMITTLPFVAVVTGIKAFLEFGVSFAGVVDFGDVGVVLTGAVFLTGFLLAGTMADYKESEKIPADVANILETIEEVLMVCASQKPALDLKELRGELLTLTDTIRGWLVKKHTTPELFAAVSKMNALVVKLDQAGASSYGNRVVPEVANLRRLLLRIDVISRTGFLPPAYALLEVLLVMILSLLMVAKFKSPIGEFIIVPVVTLLNVYMLRLIKDIDDPFDYHADGRKRGGAEVEMFPIEEYRARLASRVG
jgi:hypothetical protein